MSTTHHGNHLPQAQRPREDSLPARLPPQTPDVVSPESGRRARPLQIWTHLLDVLVVHRVISHLVEEELDDLLQLVAVALPLTHNDHLVKQEQVPGQTAQRASGQPCCGPVSPTQRQPAVPEVAQCQTNKTKACTCCPLPKVKASLLPGQPGTATLGQDSTVPRRPLSATSVQKVLDPLSWPPLEHCSNATPHSLFCAPRTQVCCAPSPHRCLTYADFSPTCYPLPEDTRQGACMASRPLSQSSLKIAS